MSIFSLLLLTAYGFGCAYLILVGAIGVFYSEPMGFTMIFIGAIGTIPYLRGLVKA